MEKFSVNIFLECLSLNCVMHCPGTESDEVYILRRRLVFSSVFIVDCMVLPAFFFTKRNDDPFRQSIAFTI